MGGILFASRAITVSDLVPGELVVGGLQLAEECVVLALLLRLHQKVDVGPGLLGRLGHGRARRGGVAKVGGGALVEQVADHDVLPVLRERHQLARHEEPLAVQVALSVRVGQIPDLWNIKKDYYEILIYTSSSGTPMFS